MQSPPKELVYCAAPPHGLATRSHPIQFEACRGTAVGGASGGKYNPLRAQIVEESKRAFVLEPQTRMGFTTTIFFHRSVPGECQVGKQVTNCVVQQPRLFEVGLWPAVEFMLHLLKS
jgi:hypothetical protein